MTEPALTDSAIRTTGRPRSEGCRVKVLSAADSLVSRDGFARVSVDAIAQAAGVSKATIYRWWPNKAAIVVEALLESTEADVQVPDSDSPEADLIERIRRTISLFRGARGQILTSLIGEAQFNPEVAGAYRRNLLGPRRAAMRSAIGRIVAAGRLKADFDVDLAIDFLYGPLYQRLLLRHAPLDDAFEREYPPTAYAALRALAGG